MKICGCQHSAVDSRSDLAEQRSCGELQLSATGRDCLVHQHHQPHLLDIALERSIELFSKLIWLLLSGGGKLGSYMPSHPN